MKLRAVVAAGVVSLAASGLGAVGHAPGPGAFPHALHARLFPVCTGCHAGVVNGDTATVFPRPSACASCHDGRQRPAVAWTRPAIPATNLRFTHTRHPTSLTPQGGSADCGQCHTVDGATSIRAVMRGVVPARPEACIRCHAHQAPSHLAQTARCRTCHLPLAQATGLDTAWLAALPRPASHSAPDFLLAHRVTAGQAQARCAVCHARESCERCHANADSVPAIASLARDTRVALLERGRQATYPLPKSHNAGWERNHSAVAHGGVEECADCHVQEGCRSCHIGDGARQQIASLPQARSGGPAGALALASSASATRGRQPAGARTGATVSAAHRGPHPEGFANDHGAAAASGSMTCTSCHAQSYCSSCHAGATKPVFHPADFMARHGAAAYGGAQNCNSCHDTETFCKTCHVGQGVATSGRRGMAYHDGQPLWLLQHGEAARKGLEGCVSCHRQQDCIQCHSATEGWGVNPHGPGFPAASMSARNQLVCSRCHVGTPQ